jgi:toxin HigB-1
MVLFEMPYYKSLLSNYFINCKTVTPLFTKIIEAEIRLEQSDNRFSKGLMMITWTRKKCFGAGAVSFRKYSCEITRSTAMIKTLVFDRYYGFLSLVFDKMAVFLKIKLKNGYRNVLPETNRCVKTLESAERIEDLFTINSLNYEVLKGDKAGISSIRVNNQYRIEFTVTDNGAEPIVSVCNILELSNHYK